MPAIPVALLAVAATTPALWVPCQVLGAGGRSLVRRVVIAERFALSAADHCIARISRIVIAPDLASAFAPSTVPFGNPSAFVETKS